MKNLHKTLGKKLLVILVVGFGFIFGPSITAQMSLSQDNILNKKMFIWLIT